MLTVLLVSAVLAPLLALATWQTVETWRHGSLFFKARDFTRKQVLTSRFAVVRLVGELLNCPFCLPHWVAGLYVGLLLPQLSENFSWFLVGWWWLLSLAVTRLSQVGNDVMKGAELSQSPPSDVVFIEDDVTFTDGP